MAALLQQFKKVLGKEEALAPEKVSMNIASLTCAHRASGDCLHLNVMEHEPFIKYSETLLCTVYCLLLKVVEPEPLLKTFDLEGVANLIKKGFSLHCISAMSLLCWKLCTVLLTYVTEQNQD